MPEGHDVLSVARLPVAPLGHVEQPVRELNPPHQIEGLVSYADRRTGHVQCAGQELNLHSPKAGGLQPLRLADAQPTHVHEWRRRESNPQITKV